MYFGAASTQLHSHRRHSSSLRRNSSSQKLRRRASSSTLTAAETNAGEGAARSDTIVSDTSPHLPPAVAPVQIPTPQLPTIEDVLTPAGSPQQHDEDSKGTMAHATSSTAVSSSSSTASTAAASSSSATAAASSTNAIVAPSTPPVHSATKFSQPASSSSSSASPPSSASSTTTSSTPTVTPQATRWDRMKAWWKAPPSYPGAVSPSSSSTSNPLPQYPKQSAAPVPIQQHASNTVHDANRGVAHSLLTGTPTSTGTTPLQSVPPPVLSSSQQQQSTSPPPVSSTSPPLHQHHATPPLPSSPSFTSPARRGGMSYGGYGGMTLNAATSGRAWKHASKPSPSMLGAGTSSPKHGSPATSFTAASAISTKPPPQLSNPSQQQQQQVGSSPSIGMTTPLRAPQPRRSMQYTSPLIAPVPISSSTNNTAPSTSPPISSSPDAENPLLIAGSPWWRHDQTVVDRVREDVKKKGGSSRNLNGNTASSTAAPSSSLLETPVKSDPNQQTITSPPSQSGLSLALNRVAATTSPAPAPAPASPVRSGDASESSSSAASSPPSQPYLIATEPPAPGAGAGPLMRQRDIFGVGGSMSSGGAAATLGAAHVRSATMGIGFGGGIAAASLLSSPSFTAGAGIASVTSPGLLSPSSASSSTHHPSDTPLSPAASTPSHRSTYSTISASTLPVVPLKPVKFDMMGIGHAAVSLTGAANAATMLTRRDSYFSLLPTSASTLSFPSIAGAATTATVTIPDPIQVPPSSTPSPASVTSPTAPATSTSTEKFFYSVVLASFPKLLHTPRVLKMIERDGVPVLMRHLVWKELLAPANAAMVSSASTISTSPRGAHLHSQSVGSFGTPLVGESPSHHHSLTLTSSMSSDIKRMQMDPGRRRGSEMKHGHGTMIARSPSTGDVRTIASTSVGITGASAAVATSSTPHDSQLTTPSTSIPTASSPPPSARASLHTSTSKPDSPIERCTFCRGEDADGVESPVPDECDDPSAMLLLCTCPALCSFLAPLPRASSASLHSVLSSFSSLSSGGYVQGVSYLAEVLLCVMPPAQAIQCLIGLFQRAFFRSMASMHVDCVIGRFAGFDLTLKQNLPELHSHLQQVNIPPDCYYLEYIATLCSKQFPQEWIARIWDSYLIYGEVFILCTVIALLKIMQPLLMRLDVTQVVRALRDPMSMGVFRVGNTHPQGVNITSSSSSRAPSPQVVASSSPSSSSTSSPIPITHHASSDRTASASGNSTPLIAPRAVFASSAHSHTSDHESLHHFAAANGIVVIDASDASHPASAAHTPSQKQHRQHQNHVTTAAASHSTPGTSATKKKGFWWWPFSSLHKSTTPEIDPNAPLPVISITLQGLLSAIQQIEVPPAALTALDG